MAEYFTTVTLLWVWLSTGNSYHKNKEQGNLLSYLKQSCWYWKWFSHQPIYIPFYNWNYLISLEFLFCTNSLLWTICFNLQIKDKPLTYLGKSALRTKLCNLHCQTTNVDFPCYLGGRKSKLRGSVFEPVWLIICYTPFSLETEITRSIVLGDSRLENKQESPVNNPQIKFLLISPLTCWIKT